MREWLRLPVSKRCGSCGVIQAVGTAMVVLSNGNKWKLYRCPACAGSEVPPMVHVPTPKELADLKDPRALPGTGLDFSQRMQEIGAVAVKFRRPEPLKPVATVKRKAYRGDDFKARQAGMLDDLPRYDH